MSIPVHLTAVALLACMPQACMSALLETPAGRSEVAAPAPASSAAAATPTSSASAPVAAASAPSEPASASQNFMPLVQRVKELEEEAAQLTQEVRVLEAKVSALYASGPLAASSPRGLAERPAIDLLREEIAAKRLRAEQASSEALDLRIQLFGYQRIGNSNETGEHPFRSRYHVPDATWSSGARREISPR